MCGITAFFARESRPDYKILDTLFKGTERRGVDGFGFITIRNVDGKRQIEEPFRDHRKYSDCKDLVESVYKTNPLNVGDVIIAISRAAPETEGHTDIDHLDTTMQPIVWKGENLMVVHNGSVSQRIYNELREEMPDKFRTTIDSEAILASYVKHGRNIKDAFEYLSGGFACIIYDGDKDCLYVINDHMQLSHGYSRVIGGFMLHSELDSLRKVLELYHGVLKDGVNIWENYYAHYLDGHAIRQIDLQSGCMSKQKYNPRYLVGDIFDSRDGTVKPIGV